MPQNSMNADTDHQIIGSNDIDRYDRLTGALIGLVRVCNHKSRTEKSDRLILKGLSLLSGTASVLCPEAVFSSGEAAASGATTVPEDEILPSSPVGLTDAIHAEKNVISPGCAVCASPCGGTFDYDMSELYQDPDSNIRSLKILLLFTAEGIAADILRNINSESNALLRYEEPIIFLYRALMAIGDTCDMDDLLMLMMEAGDLHISLR